MSCSRTQRSDAGEGFVGPDLDPNSLPLMVILKAFFEIVDFENNQQTTK